MEIKLTLISVGYSPTIREDIQEIPDKDLTSMSPEEINDYLSNYTDEWISNFIAV